MEFCLIISEIHHWVETFQIPTNPSSQPEPQQAQAPPAQTSEQHAEPLHHILPSLRGTTRRNRSVDTCGTSVVNKGATQT